MVKTTIDDVASLAGVSIKTVSRVANNEPNVRESTRLKVNDAIVALNYKPNQSARSLASRRSYLIALLYDDPSMYEIPSSGYVVNIQQGVLKICKSKNYDLLIHPCAYKDKEIHHEIRALIEHARPDGLVLAPPLSGMPNIVRAISKTGIPFSGIAPGTDVSQQSVVETDDKEACREMTQYLASLGHRRIAFITGHPDHKAVASRYDGFKAGLEASGLKLYKSLVKNGDNSFLSGEQCATKLLEAKKPPTAIFASNDDMAAGTLRAAKRLGVDVPKDLSVAGFDNIPLAQQVYPSLTTINQPLEPMAARATELLLARLGANTKPSAPELIKAQLVIRESTGPVPG